MPCAAVGCRFPSSHVTCAHRCGTCNAYGHGQRECNNQELIRILQSTYDQDTMPADKECSFLGCQYKWSHNAEAHHCFSCGTRGADQNCCVRLSQTSTGRNIQEDRVSRKCAHCKVIGPVDLAFELFTGSDCTICMETKPCIIFSACRHAVVCADCARRLDEV